MDTEKTKTYVNENFEKYFVEPLSNFIKIENLTPAFDPEFFTNGLIQQAADYVKQYAESLNIEGLEVHTYNEEGRPPMVVIVYPGNGKANIMVYGHMDKQPHMDGWKEGTGPTSAAIIGDKLYGRGSTDDGYVPFATLFAILNAIQQGADLPRIAIVLEAEEESGSKNLVYLLDKCKDWIQTPDMCICCDSGALDYSTLWLTSTLRGMIGFNLKVSIAENAVHSGMAGGAIPETFRIANTLLDRIEDPETRRMTKFEVEIPEKYLEEAKNVAEIMGEDMYKDFKLLPGCEPIHKDNLPEMYLNINWRPCMAVTGAEGLPPIPKSGNVVRSSTSLRIKIRLPPSLDAKKAAEECSKILTEDPPFGAKVEIDDLISGGGWYMKDLKEKTNKALEESSNTFYGKTPGVYGIGGSIPFLQVLGDKFPETEILALGVCGPEANIHAPNETIDLPYLRKFICTLSHTLQGLA